MKSRCAHACGSGSPHPKTRRATELHAPPFAGRAEPTTRRRYIAPVIRKVEIMKTIVESIRILIVFTLLTGVVYPLIVTGVGKAFFQKQASGSLVVSDGKIIGSELLAQKFDDPRYFAPRPSTADYATVASGASNKGPTSADLVKSIAERRTKFGNDAPGDLLTASGSGLDPHISPAAARFQVPRVAAERRVQPEKISVLVTQFTEPPQLGFLGEARVNVFALNRALDELR